MPKVSIVVVVYNSRKYLQPVFDAIASQTFKDSETIAVINASEDGSQEFLQQNYPNVKLIVPGKNTGFAGGNNLGILQSTGEFIQLVNPDLIMAPDYIEKILKAFSDSQIGAATGKLLRYDFEKQQKTNIIDSTGIIMSSSGRGKDRGQLEEDKGQYDNQLEVFGVSGACPMYRRSALEHVQYSDQGRVEYFDEDFVAYWEDVDLSWRLNNVGFKCLYVPDAVGYHGRTAGQSKGGYLHFWHYTQHHRKISPIIRKLNYKNHILMYLKNTRFIHPAFVVREIIMFFYVLIFETSTLAVLPELFRLIPKMYNKRRAAKY